MTIIRLIAFLTCGLLFNGICKATDENLIIVGPNGRSSIGSSITFFKFNYEQQDTLSNQKIGRVSENGSVITLTGVYALSNRVSLLSTLPWVFNQRYSNNFFGTYVSGEKPNQSGFTIGVSALLLGDIEQKGFRLTGYVGTSFYDHNNSVRYSASITPQYWINRFVGISAAASVTNAADLYTTSNAQFNIFWRPAPQWTFSPWLAASNVLNYGSSAPPQSRSLGLGITYAFDPDWAVFGNGSLGERDAQTRTSSLTIDNYRSRSINIGIRRSF
jgi:hypothetical protein